MQNDNHSLNTLIVWSLEQLINSVFDIKRSPQTPFCKIIQFNDVTDGVKLGGIS